MPATPPNMINELLLGLLSNTRMPMKASPGLTQHLRPYVRGRQNPQGALDPTNLIDPLEPLGAGPVGARTPEPPPISRDPWFDQMMPEQSDPTGNRTLIRDMMRATGIEPRGSFDRYYSQLLEIEPAFLQRIARQLGIDSQGLDRKGLANLIADEFSSL